VSFGTSAPELFVSITAALNGSPDIAMGNVVGSNIANIGLVLGITAMLFPLVIDRNSVVIDWPAMMISSLIFIAFAWDYEITRIEGSCLFVILILFIFFLIRNSHKAMMSNGEEKGHLHASPVKSHILKHILMVAAGCCALVLGAHLLVDNAIVIARTYQVSERIIGITAIAFGTSLPELATSCIAAFRKQTDISVGNLIGSNIFNILAIIGITTMVKPMQHINAGILQTDMVWMIGIAAILFPLLFFGKKLSRWEGGILFISYIAYYYMILS
ncbi:MAG: calcium/sodium antiporter, partial [Flavobacteriales bacterium]